MATEPIALVRTTWGVTEFGSPATWDDVLGRLKGLHYAAIEHCIGPFDSFQADPALGRQLRTKHGLDAIGQLHTCGYPVASRRVEDHVKSFSQLVQLAKAAGVIFANSHSGHDSWSLEESLQFFREANKIAHEAGLLVTHETHRRRALYSPWRSTEIITALPELRITADLSHWAVVSERIFDDPADAEWWPKTLSLVASRAALIHARVGYAQGPQVPHPAAPEYAAGMCQCMHMRCLFPHQLPSELAAHEKWWDAIVASMRSQGRRVYVEPEHGPAPYLHTLAFTNVPVADLWEVNTWIGKRLQARYNTAA